MKKIRFGYTADLLEAPITYGFECMPSLKNQVVLQKHKTTDICRHLIDGQLDVAFITPADYAKNSRELQIIPSLMVASRWACPLALLFFRENLESLEKIAVFGEATIYRELAGLVMQEFFETVVEWYPSDLKPELENALATHPICLFEGQAALENAFKSDRSLDIVEEWVDKTDLPFVHRILAMRRNSPVLEAGDLVLKSFDIGWRNLEKITKSFTKPPIDWTFYFDLLNNSLYFQPVGEEWEAIRLYFQYLFYHGKLDDIPEIHLFS